MYHLYNIISIWAAILLLCCGFIYLIRYMTFINNLQILSHPYNDNLLTMAVGVHTNIDLVCKPIRFRSNKWSQSYSISLYDICFFYLQTVINQGDINFENIIKNHSSMQINYDRLEELENMFVVFMKRIVNVMAEKRIKSKYIQIDVSNGANSIISKFCQLSSIVDESSFFNNIMDIGMSQLIINPKPNSTFWIHLCRIFTDPSMIHYRIKNVKKLLRFVDPNDIEGLMNYHQFIDGWNKYKYKKSHLLSDAMHDYVSIYDDIANEFYLQEHENENQFIHLQDPLLNSIIWFEKTTWNRGKAQITPKSYKFIELCTMFLRDIHKSFAYSNPSLIFRRNYKFFASNDQKIALNDQNSSLIDAIHDLGDKPNILDVLYTVLLPNNDKYEMMIKSYGTALTIANEMIQNMDMTHFMVNIGISTIHFKYNNGQQIISWSQLCNKLISVFGTRSDTFDLMQVQHRFPLGSNTSSLASIAADTNLPPRLQDLDGKSQKLLNNWIDVMDPHHQKSIGLLMREYQNQFN